MDAGRISTRYARAIYRYAESRGEEKQLWDEMKRLAVQFFKLPELKKTLDSPVLPIREKEQLLLAAVGNNPSESFRRAIGMVAANSRSGYMHSIALMYDRVFRKQKRLLCACLVSASPVEEAERNSLVELLVDKNDKKIEFETLIDTDLIGGFVLQIDDRRLNASLKHQLDHLRMELTKQH
jgi:F-type H+-transporting ATPase subunit delta